jgi:hypothetical protein
LHDACLKISHKQVCGKQRERGQQLTSFVWTTVASFWFRILQLRPTDAKNDDTGQRDAASARRNLAKRAESTLSSKAGE